MSKVSKTYSSTNKQVLKDIYLSFFYGAKIGILGLNGSGKSSLLKIIAGVDKNYQGDVVFAQGYSVGYLEQEPQLDETKTVIEIVKEGMSEVVGILDEFNKINDMFGLPEVYEDADKMQKLMDRQAELQDKIDAVGGWELDTKLAIAMDALRCPEADTPINVLSGGERRRVALCRLLLQEPDVLLLDEPTNHLDAESVHWLEQHLQQYKGTIIAVTHDRYFLDNVAGWILELDRGEGIPLNRCIEKLYYILNKPAGFVTTLHDEKGRKSISSLIGSIPGKFANKIDADSNGTADNDANALGSIGTVFGGGNAANVVGNTNVNISTKTTVNLVSGSDHTDKTVKGVNISGNVYGGGNAADVTGKTNVTVGR